MKWLIRLLIKPVIRPIKEAIRLCNKLIETIEKLITVVNGLPLEQSFKDEILKTLKTTEDAILTVRAVLIKVLKSLIKRRATLAPQAINIPTMKAAIRPNTCMRSFKGKPLISRLVFHNGYKDPIHNDITRIWIDNKI